MHAPAQLCALLQPCGCWLGLPFAMAPAVGRRKAGHARKGGTGGRGGGACMASTLALCEGLKRAGGRAPQGGGGGGGVPRPPGGGQTGGGGGPPPGGGGGALAMKMPMYLYSVNRNELAPSLTAFWMSAALAMTSCGPGGWRHGALRGGPRICWHGPPCGRGRAAAAAAAAALHSPAAGLGA